MKQNAPLDYTANVIEFTPNPQATVGHKTSPSAQREADGDCNGYVEPTPARYYRNAAVEMVRCFVGASSVAADFINLLVFSALVLPPIAILELIDLITDGAVSVFIHDLFDHPGTWRD